MKSKVIVYTQFYENYNVGPDGFGEVPHWKPKGGHEFSVEIDSDILMYSGDSIKNALKEMVEEQSTIAEKFEFRGYELKWSEPTKLDSKEFESKLDKQYE